jgi:hypothetical protein
MLWQEQSQLFHTLALMSKIIILRSTHCFLNCTADKEPWIHKEVQSRSALAQVSQTQLLQGAGQYTYTCEPPACVAATHFHTNLVSSHIMINQLSFFAQTLIDLVVAPKKRGFVSTCPSEARTHIGTARNGRTGSMLPCNWFSSGVPSGNASRPYEYQQCY